MVSHTNGRTRRLRVFENGVQKYFEDGGSMFLRNVGICRGVTTQKTKVENCCYGCDGTVFVRKYGSG
jgi:hypothetical protein